MCLSPPSQRLRADKARQGHAHHRRLGGESLPRYWSQGEKTRHGFSSDRHGHHAETAGETPAFFVSGAFVVVYGRD